MAISDAEQQRINSTMFALERLRNNRELNRLERDLLQIYIIEARNAGGVVCSPYNASLMIELEVKDKLFQRTKKRLVALGYIASDYVKRGNSNARSDVTVQEKSFAKNFKYKMAEQYSAYGQQTKYERDNPVNVSKPEATSEIPKATSELPQGDLKATSGAIPSDLTKQVLSHTGEEFEDVTRLKWKYCDKTGKFRSGSSHIADDRDLTSMIAGLKEYEGRSLI